MEYGSLINYVLGNATFPDPEVGMECTMLSWSDRYPFKVVEINRQKNGKIKTVVVQAMKHEADKTKSREMGHQNWIISDDPNGHKMVLKFRNTKRHYGWYSKSESGWGSKFLMGVAEYHYDWSF